MASILDVILFYAYYNKHGKHDIHIDVIRALVLVSASDNMKDEEWWQMKNNRKSKSIKILAKK